jgi:hypothetical protein
MPVAPGSTFGSTLGQEYLYVTVTQIRPATHINKVHDIRIQHTSYSHVWPKPLPKESRAQPQLKQNEGIPHMC